LVALGDRAKVEYRRDAKGCERFPGSLIGRGSGAVEHASADRRTTPGAMTSEIATIG
jgi:hypothetical protein